MEKLQLTPDDVCNLNKVIEKDLLQAISKLQARVV